MLTKEQYDALKAKKESELTDEEKTSIAEYDVANTKNSEHMIPKSRLDEEITKRKELETRLADLEKTSKEAETKRLQEQNDYKTLFENANKELATLRPKAVIADESQKTMEGLLESQVASIPEAMRSLIPERLSVSEKLDYIAKNQALLSKQPAFDINAGKNGGSGGSLPELTAEEQEVAKRFGYSQEDYAKNKEK